MKFLELFLLFATIITAANCGSDVEFIPPEPDHHSTTLAPSSSTSAKPTHSTEKPTVPPSTTTTEPPKSTTTTTQPSTTNPTSPTTKLTTPSTKPTTPSTKPSTPSTKPTTPSTKPTTPTPKPTPEPTKPTPGPTPKPPVEPEVGTWFVNRTVTNHSCIILQSAIQIQIENGIYNVSKNVSSRGSCMGEEFIELIWPSSMKGNNSVMFKFDNKTNKFDVKQIKVTFVGKNATYTLVHQKEEFGTNLKNSYKCEAEQKLDLIDDKNKTMGHLILSKLQVQAYQNSTGFSNAVNCIASGTPDIVPIAVGCALVVLVIIVLVAYLVGRKRSQARGYLSM